MSHNAVMHRQTRVPGEIIAHAVYLSCRFALNCREIEAPLTELDVQVGEETVGQ